MEPVDGAAADEGGEHPQPAPKGVPDGAHCQYNVEVLPNALYEQVVHGQRGGLNLPSLCVGGERMGGEGTSRDVWTGAEYIRTYLGT